MTDLRTTGVWISADSAKIVQWSPESTWRHRIESGVPGRHRATGRAPTQHRGQGDGRRDEHMRAFFDRVVHALSLDNDLLLVGDGEVVGHFADQVRADDAKHGRERRIEVVESGPLTERQLVARTRAFAAIRPFGAGVEPTLGFEPEDLLFGNRPIYDD